MSLIAKMTERFKEERILFASVIVNAEITPIFLEYEPDKITINNLGEDLPPFIRIWRDEKKVKASSDKIKWLELDEHESQELQIYRLLDPVFLLPGVDVERTVEVTSKIFLIDGSYPVNKLDFPQALIEHFEEEKNLLRWIRLYILDDGLLSMSQQDFPPYSDVVTLLFSKSPLPYLPQPIFLVRTK